MHSRESDIYIINLQSFTSVQQKTIIFSFIIAVKNEILVKVMYLKNICNAKNLMVNIKNKNKRISPVDSYFMYKLKTIFTNKRTKK